MHVRLLDRYEQLASQSDAWNALACETPFLRWEWLGTWWRHYGRGRRLFVPSVVDDAGHVVGFAPWHIDAHPALGRVLRFLGAGEACTDYLTLLTSPGHESAVADAIAEWLTTDASVRRRWDKLELDGPAKDDPAIWRLIEKLAAQGNTLHRRDGMNAWRIDLPGTWDEFLSWQSKSHRKQVRRAIADVDNGRARLQWVRTSEEFAEAWPVLVDLHQRRRISLGEPGCFASRRFHDFLREAAALFLTAGLLRFYLIEINGRPAAAEVAFQGGKTVFVYQAGVDPDLLDEEPGRKITAAVIRQLIEEGIEGFDWLRGDEPYKAHWRAKPHRLEEWRVVPPRTAPQLRHSAWLAGAAMRHWLRNAYERLAVPQTS